MIPAIVYNHSANEFFVAWSAGDKMSPDPRSGAWQYLYGQRLTGTGALIGTQAIAFAKVEAVNAYWDLGALAFDDVANEYLVAWAARPWDVEIVTQRVGADGTLLGNMQVSRMGPDGDQRFKATSPAVAFNTSTGAALVAWQGDDNTAPLVDDEMEIFARVVTRPTPFVVGLGEFAGEGGWLAKRADAPGFASVGWAQVPWPDYNLSGGGTYPAMGDIDGDGEDELILGLNPSGHRWLVILDDAAAQHRTLGWIQLPWPSFDTALHPAAGDIDGDGVDEIVIGLGPGTAGWFAVLDDVLSHTPTLTWRQVEWPFYTSADGRTHPAVGDVDGDGAEEIIIGLGPGSNGWLEIFGGATPSLAHREWLWVPWPEYTAANGTTWPAAGDVDADGRDEVIAGLGTGGHGWFAVFDHPVTGFELRRWLQVTWPAYNDAVGETHPAVGNLDLDPGAEIAIGLGRYGSEGGWFQVFDNFLTYPGLDTLAWGRVGWQAFEADGGATFPAIGPRR